jgi:hypothetical protein
MHRRALLACAAVYLSWLAWLDYALTWPDISEDDDHAA